MAKGKKAQAHRHTTRTSYKVWSRSRASIRGEEPDDTRQLRINTEGADFERIVRMVQARQRTFPDREYGVQVVTTTESVAPVAWGAVA